MEQFQSLVPIDWQNQRVITTAQLAEYYGCSVQQIQQNFNNNRDRFVEGKHYFKLESDALRKFKRDCFDSESDSFDNIEVVVNARTRVLYLWTKRGAARHAKMISNDKAWEVFEALEDYYFDRQTVSTSPAKPAQSARRDAQRKLACVYVLLMSNGIVKIGYSGKLRSRVAKIENQTDLTVHDIYFTPFTSREIARFVEWVCQKKFSSRKVKGEFFSVKFNEACAAVENFFAKAVHALSSVMKIEGSAAVDF